MGHIALDVLAARLTRLLGAAGGRISMDSTNCMLAPDLASAIWESLFLGLAAHQIIIFPKQRLR